MKRFHHDDPRPRVLRAVADAIERGEAHFGEGSYVNFQHPGDWFGERTGGVQVLIDVRSFCPRVIDEIRLAAMPRLPEPDREVVAQWSALFGGRL
jgi:hypothetical protein